MTSNIPLWEAYELGRHLLSPCAGGGKTSNGNGCALQMALAAIGSKDSWAGAGYVWKWLHQPSGLTYLDRETGKQEPRIWMSLVWSKFDNDVMTDKTMSMDEFGAWLRAIEPPAPPVPSLVEIPVESEVPR